ncbi:MULTISPECIES: UDP-N-acetylglucosamine 2-epimerase [unclassified Flavobacterium]|uniref:UDP-N-acetylglucosamine 2-epimerase n=1 Tax=unclassified Flavobacterium TaxID=196869 RepID=UPI003F8EB184
MRVGILTSSRADYGIYLPLIEKMKSDSFFEIEIIAFGTHLSKSHGYTVKDIEKDGYSCIRCISSLISNDDEQAISSSYGLTVLKFSDFWASHTYDLVFCLGDRFEMSAAVQAGIPFGVKFAHIHGGETTLGAIDNVYRHQITIASHLHFTATDVFKDKVKSLIESQDNIYSVGSLSLDNLSSFVAVDKDILCEKFAFPDKEFALVTFHPETVESGLNHSFAEAMRTALGTIAASIIIVITMPNADTLGSIYRDALIKLKNENPDRIFLVENFGKANYFSAMYYSKLLIGNTSSGILEAASFGKYVVNVGDRQKGRVQSDNIVNAPFDNSSICLAFQTVLEKGVFEGTNVYCKKEVAENIIKIVKKNS